MQAELNDFLSKIEALEAENSALSEKAEDSLLLGSVAEIIHQAEHSGHLIDLILERISTLKNIPLCVYFEYVESKISILNYYASFAGFNSNAIQFSFPDCSKRIALDKNFLILGNENFQEHDFSFRITGHQFQPQKALVIKCLTKSTSDKYFLFLDDTGSEDKFSKMQVILKQTLQLVTEQLDKISIFEELTKLNKELDQRVTERTTELTRINSSLNKEIIVRKIIEQALSENEKQLRSVFNAAIDVAFISVDLPGESIVRSFSPGSEKMFGYSANEVIGKPIDILYLQDQVNLLTSVKSDQIEKGLSRKEEIVMRRKSGELFPAILNVYPMKDDSGTLNGALAVCIDITERKKVETELIAAKEKAEESDRLKTAFLQNMSHEIRTPMNAIMGFADLLPEFFDDKKKLNKFAKIIKNRGVDLLEVITEILDIAKIESGQLNVIPEVCKMGTLFGEVELLIDEYRKRIDKNQIEFKLRIGQNVRMLEVFIDQEKLKQILINLIRNAFKFTNSGKIELCCKIYEPKVFTFSIADTGIGIAKEKHTEIFSPFTQASNDKSQLYGGPGLGLSIVQGLLNLLGGKIWLESEKGKGSTFFFSLPFVMKDQQVPKISKEKSSDKSFFQSNAKILIVEDDEYNAEYLLEILSDTDFDILHTCYGRKAIEICAEQAIDMVLMDIRLSDLNGYEVTSQIKSRNPEIKVIAQTAYATLEDRQIALESGCDDYLSKPIGRELLMSRINHHLGIKEKSGYKKS